MPLVFTTIVQLGDSKDVCELSEKHHEEEQRNEQEPEEKDVVDEFLIHSRFTTFFSRTKDLNHSSKAKKITAVNREVLTPPPDLI